MRFFHVKSVLELLVKMTFKYDKRYIKKYWENYLLKKRQKHFVSLGHHGEKKRLHKHFSH